MSSNNGNGMQYRDSIIERYRRILNSGNVAKTPPNSVKPKAFVPEQLLDENYKIRIDLPSPQSKIDHFVNCLKNMLSKFQMAKCVKIIDVETSFINGKHDLIFVKMSFNPFILALDSMKKDKLLTPKQINKILEKGLAKRKSKYASIYPKAMVPYKVIAHNENYKNPGFIYDFLSNALMQLAQGVDASKVDNN